MSETQAPDLDALERLLAEATPAPWAVGRFDVVMAGPVMSFANGTGQQQIMMMVGQEWMRHGEKASNAALIAAAINALPWLIARARDADTAEKAIQVQANAVRVIDQKARAEYLATQTLDSERDMNAELTAELERAYTAFAQLNADPTLQAQRDDAERRAKQAEQEVEALRAQLQQAERGRDEAAHTLRECEKERDHLCRELNTRDQEVDDYSGHLEERDARIACLVAALRYYAEGRHVRVTAHATARAQEAGICEPDDRDAAGYGRYARAALGDGVSTGRVP